MDPPPGFKAAISSSISLCVIGLVGINDRGDVCTVGTELANFPLIPTEKSLNALAIAAVPVISQPS
jgi:hypothetical protein